MVKYYDSIPDFLLPWIEKQKMFWVATAPLTGDGLVNVSPKGMTGTFHIINTNKVWYEDLTGSGIETVAHVRENGRITVLFHAFEGPPRICRMYGRGTVHEFGTPEYDQLLPLEKRKVGSRSIVMLDIFKVGISCGYAVPLMEYKGERNRLVLDLYKAEVADVDAEKDLDLSSPSSEPPLPTTGLKRYWSFRNDTSLDGLPGMLVGHQSHKTFAMPEPIQARRREDLEDLEAVSGKVIFKVGVEELKFIAAFLAGAMISTSYFNYVKPRGW
ncbi:hypothetical protein J132_09963 [Termitomyces sp. J132]|nr:hypothetical protein H2248_003426 [Termitomyces sp. 'cryptogamus']KNZ76541.1 hypothetical protein J132_09963 [Termitomyces sp. J132]